MLKYTDPDFTNLAHHAATGKGYTAYLNKEEYAGRYIVGGIKTATIPTGTPNMAAIVKLIATDFSATRPETIGTWEEDGLTYIDAGSTYYSLSVALEIATNRGELAIYDRITNTEIRV